jgi:hypothetical protein
MIVLDEAWALIDNPVFAPKIKDWLKVLRKLNTFVIFATQSVEDAAKSKISDTLIQQTATQIFLPNLKATEVYKTSFMLSEREYTLIKTTDPSSRYFLVKQGVNAIVARVDLSGLGNIINVLSGRSDTVLLLEELRKQYGDDPSGWLPDFHKKRVGNEANFKKYLLQITMLFSIVSFNSYKAYSVSFDEVTEIISKLTCETEGVENLLMDPFTHTCIQDPISTVALAAVLSPNMYLPMMMRLRMDDQEDFSWKLLEKK